MRAKRRGVGRVRDMIMYDFLWFNWSEAALLDPTYKKKFRYDAELVKHVRTMEVLLICLEK